MFITLIVPMHLIGTDYLVHINSDYIIYKTRVVIDGLALCGGHVSTWYGGLVVVAVSIGCCTRARVHVAPSPFPRAQSIVYIML